MGLGTVIAGLFGGVQAPAAGLTYTPATVAGGAAAGASAGSLSSTLTGSVSYSVLSGALAVNASTGALTTTGTAPSSGSMAARVIAENGSQIVGRAISVPVQATAAAPVAQSAPAISGLAASGNTLTVTPGTYTGAASVTGQWQKNGVAISGATGSSYTVQASDGVNIAYLETATSSGGQTATQRAVSRYLGQVATGSRICERLNTNNKQCMARSPHVARDNITSLQLVFPNWYWASSQNTVTDRAEHVSGGTATYRASIEYPAGIFTQVLFGGNVTSAAIAGGQNAVSDTTSVNIPAGARFWVRVFSVNTAALVFWQQFDYLNGGNFAYAASGIVDQTMGGTITNTDASPGAGSGNTNGGTTAESVRGYGPCAIIANTSVPSVALIGDSRCEGWGDTFDASGDLGELARSIGPSLPYINLGCYGDTVTKWNASHGGRLGIAQYCSHFIAQAGINDLVVGGSSAATLQSDESTQWSTLSALGRPTYTATMTPVSSSTDQWATTTNQTTSTHNADRVSVNAIRRSTPAPLAGYFELADVNESARDSGLWKANGSSYAFTVEGTHESQTGYLAIKNGGAINAAVFNR